MVSCGLHGSLSQQDCALLSRRSNRVHAQYEGADTLNYGIGLPGMGGQRDLLLDYVLPKL